MPYLLAIAQNPYILYCIKYIIRFSLTGGFCERVDTGTRTLGLQSHNLAR